MLHKMLHEILHEMLYEMLYEKRIHELCSNHHDDEIKMKNLRLHESDSEILRHRHI